MKWRSFLILFEDLLFDGFIRKFGVRMRIDQYIRFGFMTDYFFHFLLFIYLELYNTCWTFSLSFFVNQVGCYSYFSTFFFIIHD